MVLESSIEKSVVKYARDNGWLVLKIQHARGWPDRVFFKDGKTLFIEFKAPNGKLSKMQTIMIGKLKDSGMDVFIVNDKALGKVVIDDAEANRFNR